MQPTIKTIENKTFVGMSKIMSLKMDRTGFLFRTFMPRRKEISNRMNEKVFDLREYSPGYFENLNPAHEFNKWALMEVSDVENVPEMMEMFQLKAGKYAVFIHKGLMSDHRIFEYIFSKWLPNSGYLLDDRPHFEILGEKSKINDPESEEEIWIPIKNKV